MQDENLCVRSHTSVLFAQPFCFVHTAKGLSLDEVLRETLITAQPKSIFEQGLGLFGSPENTALLDEVVGIAYEERRRPTKLPLAP